MMHLFRMSLRIFLLRENHHKDNFPQKFFYKELYLRETYPKLSTSGKYTPNLLLLKLLIGAFHIRVSTPTDAFPPNALCRDFPPQRSIPLGSSSSDCHLYAIFSSGEPTQNTFQQVVHRDFPPQRNIAKGYFS